MENVETEFLKRSEVNMMMLDSLVMDKIRAYIHEAYHFLDENPSLFLKLSRDLIQLFVIFKFIIPESIRADMDTQLLAFRNKVYRINFARIQPEQVLELDTEFTKLLEKVYQLKQHAGLGFPVRKTDTAESLRDKIREA